MATSQPRSRSAAGSVPATPFWLGSAARLLGSLRPSLPAANTTRPPWLITNGRYSAATCAVVGRSVQYRPPHELFITFTL
ncbi:hypothetical protein VM57_14410 [Stenotrophomonas maltophilia]|uniref:Uncharacterized protein n=1 Tax=Stenotrophomonas maltophilia TaxID=40324 RepID=A0A0F5ZNW4_STEMA|nr:hypothetical protein VM57_14410 [Stenotrophomonas maltophilia]